MENTNKFIRKAGIFLLGPEEQKNCSRAPRESLSFDLSMSGQQIVLEFPEVSGPRVAQPHPACRSLICVDSNGGEGYLFVSRKE